MRIIVFFLIFAAACREPAEPRGRTCSAAMLSAEEAVVTFAWTSRADTMHVLVRGNDTVRDACAYLAGESNASIPNGQIARGPSPSDPDLPFHYVPESVQLAEFTIELCDSALLKTAGQVEAYFAGTGNAESETAPYCPWSARPVRVQ